MTIIWDIAVFSPMKKNLFCWWNLYTKTRFCLDDTLSEKAACFSSQHKDFLFSYCWMKNTRFLLIFMRTIKISQIFLVDFLHIQSSSTASRVSWLPNIGWLIPYLRLPNVIGGIPHPWYPQLIGRLIPLKGF
jgi:hypothetical protein